MKLRFSIFSPLFTLIFVLASTESFAGPLHVAARTGDLRTIHQLLTDHPKAVDELDEDGKPAIAYALENGQNEAISMLMFSGASVELAKASLKKMNPALTEAELDQAFSYFKTDPLSDSSRLVRGVTWVVESLVGTKSNFSSDHYSKSKVSLKELELSDWRLLEKLPVVLENHDIPLQNNYDLMMASSNRRVIILQQSIRQGKGKWASIKEYCSGLVSKYHYSCGPISISFSYKLMGHHREWSNYILGFPYFLMGVFPDRLTSHHNLAKGETEPVISHLMATEFDQILQTIQQEIDQNKPVVALLVQTAIGQHYVNIVGYNQKDSLVLILDPTGELKTYSYDWLEKIMYAGVRKDLGIPYLMGSMVTVPLFMLKTEFGYYNLFTFNSESLAETKKDK